MPLIFSTTLLMPLTFSKMPTKEQIFLGRISQILGTKKQISPPRIEQLLYPNLSIQPPLARWGSLPL